MLKKTMILLIPLFLFACRNADFVTSAGDSTPIDEELFRQLFEQQMQDNPAVDDAKVASYLDDLSPGGRFASVTYTQETTSLAGEESELAKIAENYNHLINLRFMARQYLLEGSAYYKDEALAERILLGLNYWTTFNPTDLNWWNREIGYPKRFFRPVFLMKDAIEANPKFRKRFGNYLAYDETFTGTSELLPETNSLEKGQMRLMGAILLKDTATIESLSVQAKRNLTGIINSTEKGNSTGYDVPKLGILPDYSFNLHGAYGAQIYWGNYGKEYLRGLGWWLDVFEGTDLAFTQESLGNISDAYLEGVQYFAYKGFVDPFVNGRFLYNPKGRDSAVKSFLEALTEFVTFDPPRKAELEVFKERLEVQGVGGTPTSSFVGTKSFWGADMVVARTADYYISLRMTSKRTVPAEYGNGNGVNNYYTGSGAMWIMLDGGQYYKNNVLNNFNWYKLPGTTLAQDDRVFPEDKWGQGGNNATNFAGSASLGSMSVAGFNFGRGDVKAKKAWFFFEDGFVALGNSIKSNSAAPVQTTLNQFYTASSPVSGQKVWAANVGYINLDAADLVVNKGSRLVDISIQHGIAPNNKTYKYAVIPNVSASELNAYDIDAKFEVLSNTGRIQAGRFKDSGVIQVVFYSAGSLSIDGNSLSVDAPVILMLTPKGASYTVSVATPFGYLDSNNSVTVRFKGQSTSLNYGSGLYKGQTVSRDF